MKSQILELLKQAGCQCDSDVELRVEQMLECITDNSPDIQTLIVWHQTEVGKLDTEISVIPFQKCEEWNFNEAGNFSHSSGGFGKFIGVSTDAFFTEGGKSWSQPMIDQGTRSSVVGLIKKRIDGRPKYLVQLKFEPGNYGLLQFSPTLQATYSNLNQLHGGRKPHYSEYFLNEVKGTKVLYQRWYPEDGGKFYRKRVSNIIIEDQNDEPIPLHDRYRWLTMQEIKGLLKFDNLVNSHLRSVISYL